MHVIMLNGMELEVHEGEAQYIRGFWHAVVTLEMSTLTIHDRRRIFAINSFCSGGQHIAFHAAEQTRRASQIGQSLRTHTQTQSDQRVVESSDHLLQFESSSDLSHSKSST